MQGSAGSGQQGFGRLICEIQGVGDLADRVVVEVAEDEGRPLALGQMLERGHESGITGFDIGADGRQRWPGPGQLLDAGSVPFRPPPMID